MLKNLIITILSILCITLILTDLVFENTDVNRDGKTDILDLLIVQKKIIGGINETN